MTHTTQMT